jgi:hypothetical protein
MRAINTSGADGVFGRPLPQAPEAERAVLGSLLINASALERVSGIIVPDDFASGANSTIYTTCLELDADGIEPDILTVIARLRERKMISRVGGAEYIAGLIDRIPDCARVETYARMVRRKAQLRELMVAGADLIARAGESVDDPEDIAAELSERLQLIRPADVTASVLTLDDVGDKVLSLYEGGGVARGAKTGWASLDEYFTIPRGSFTLVTGIPGHGKSGFIDQLGINVARLHKWQVAMFSAENWPPESHVASLIEKYVGKPFNEGPTARMTPDEIRAGLAFVSRHFRFINPSAEGMTIDRLLGIASALAVTQPIDVLTIDPWNELQHDRADGVTETEYISVCLSKVRRWAKEHRSHVFLVAHPAKMQKDRESGKYQVPTPYDVSGSAHWRNKADQCLAVYRDITNGDDDPAVAIHVQKIRRREHGRIGQVVLHYDRVTSEYHDPARPRRFADVRRFAAEGRA